MKIKLNNTEEQFDSNQLSVSELLKLKNFTFKLIVIKVNGNVIKKEDRDATKIQDGDEVDVIHLISGG